jgi:hypothetical protein
MTRTATPSFGVSRPAKETLDGRSVAVTWVGILGVRRQQGIVSLATRKSPSFTLRPVTLSTFGLVLDPAQEGLVLLLNDVVGDEFALGLGSENELEDHAPLRILEVHQAFSLEACHRLASVRPQQVLQIEPSRVTL